MSYMTYYIISSIIMLVSVLIQGMVKNNYQKYAKVKNGSGKSGRQIAEEILARNNIRDIRVDMGRGWLSDHYSPNEKVIRLSPDVFQGTSVSSAAIAAHEVGHAIQHNVNYGMIGLRQALVLPASYGSNLGIFILVIGIALDMWGLGVLGVALFSFAFLFQLVTLPVEFDASRRAKKELQKFGIINSSQAEGVKSVLDAAALTYVAAATASLFQLLYFLSILNKSKKR